MRLARKLLLWAAGVVVGLLAVVYAAIFFAPLTFSRLLDKASLAVGVAKGFIPPPLPVAHDIREAYWLDQTWSHRDRFWFHHASQGTATLPVPYDWFVELQRGELPLPTGLRRLADSDYLERFGFIPSPKVAKGEKFAGASAPDAAKFGYHGQGPADVVNAAGRDRVAGYPDNPDGLPVGFARLPAGLDPTTNAKYPDQIGLTCSACHTGHLEYRNVSLRFDGGPAMVNLDAFSKAIGLSIGFTLELPWRFNGFADRVAKRNPEWKDKDKLKAEMSKLVSTLLTVNAWEKQSNGTPDVEEGIGRLDALNRIGNQVFFNDLLTEDDFKDPKRVPARVVSSYRAISAPVSFPPLWDTPSLLWVQYDASIFNELVRNAGESLGVTAKLNMTGADPGRHFSSSIRLATMVEMEKMLRGTDPLAGKAFNGLTAPKWSDAAKIFGKGTGWDLDDAKVDRGRDLYRTFCVECHRGPVRDAKFDSRWPDVSFWASTSPDRTEPNWLQIGDRNYFNVVQKPVADMGTDRQQSRVLIERQVALPPELNVHPVSDLNKRWNCRVPDDEGLNASFGLALMAVVGRTIDQWFAENPTDPKTEQEMRGPRPNCPNPRTFTGMQKADAAAPGPGRIVPHYRTRPLDGVWATAPYLHNGSVPTLRAMLTPQKDRPSKFCMGSRQFDPAAVGLKIDVPPCATGLTEIDTSELGNSNAGHSFEGMQTDIRKLPPGVIGRALTDSERDDLVEYLKTL